MDYRESQTVRASVFDVCKQLGALDDNSLVAEWMFNDPSAVGNENPLRRRNQTSRFKEMFSQESLVELEEQAPSPRIDRPRRKFLPFSIKAPAFSIRLCSRSKQSMAEKGSDSTKPCEQPPLPTTTARSGRVSLKRGSFFKRSTHNPDKSAESIRTSTTVFDGGRVSTHPRSFFQRKYPSHETSQGDHSSAYTSRSHTMIHIPSSPTIVPTTPVHSQFTKQVNVPDIIEEDDDDANWEEIDATPNSPVYPLPNKGMNPSSVFLRETNQSTGVVESDADSGVVMRGATHYKFAFALPRIVFRSPFKRGHTAQSTQHRTSSTRTSTTTSSHRVSASIPPKQPKALTKKVKHRSLSGSLPSPSALLRPKNHYKDKSPVLTPKTIDPPPPVRPISDSVLLAKQSSMGYHHQFFVQAEAEAGASTKSF